MKFLPTKTSIVFALLALPLACVAFPLAAKSDTASRPPFAPQVQNVEAAFSPGPAGLNLVLETIAGARNSIRLAAYSFTSYPVTKALVDAKHRGVDVQIVVDERHNLRTDRSGKARSALSALVNAGIPVHLNGNYAILHDKFVIADSKTVQTGSFNYSAAAERANSENVIVIRDNSALASQYLQHWQIRFKEGQPFKMPY